MPIYEYECLVCGEVFERLSTVDERSSAKCECGGLAKQLISVTGKDWFRPHWNENFDIKPIFVETKSKYKELCAKYGVYARCLD